MCLCVCVCASCLCVHKDCLNVSIFISQTYSLSPSQFCCGCQSGDLGDSDLGASSSKEGEIRFLAGRQLPADPQGWVMLQIRGERGVISPTVAGETLDPEPGDQGIILHL